MLDIEKVDDSIIMNSFEECAVGNKVRRDDGYVGEIVSVTGKRFRARFAWSEPQTIWRGDQPEKSTHFFCVFRKSDGRSVGQRKKYHWALPAV